MNKQLNKNKLEFQIVLCKFFFFFLSLLLLLYKLCDSGAMESNRKQFKMSEIIMKQLKLNNLNTTKHYLDNYMYRNVVKIKIYSNN